MKSLIGIHGVPTVLEVSARKLSARLRPAVFAIAADIALVDGRMERSEARFLRGLAADLGLSRDVADSILHVIRIKNSA